MFNVVVEQRKRRVWTARTVAISIGAHLLVLAAVVTAAANSGPPPPKVDVFDIGRAPQPKTPTPVKPTPPPPADQPVVKGRTLALQAPTTVPPNLPPATPDAPAVDPSDYSGAGPVGTVIDTTAGTPDPGPVVPAPPLPDFRDDVIPAEEAEQLPELASPRETQRMLERAYPPHLRDAGVTGHTTVVLVIDKSGNVQPGSVSVRETTHDAFREAAVRTAERFRFRPARQHGEPVAVRISIPIDWQIVH